MEFITNAQKNALNKIATIQSNEKSKPKGAFPKRKFSRKDIVKMIENRNRIGHTMKSVLKSASVIKQHNINKQYKTNITLEEYKQLNDYITNTLSMDSWGVAVFEEHEIFKGDGIPYKNVIVMSKHMKNDTFVVKDLPNMECMLEVMEVYGDTGVASLKTTEFLRIMNFGAVPNHSLGGNIDYSKAGFKANLGFMGRHGLLITPHSGSCNRLSVVYTSIENLNDFLTNNDDHTWGEEFCKKCGNCIRNCPYDAIYEEAKICENVHVECIENTKCGSGFAHYGCAICIAACPFTKLGYTEIKKRFYDIK